jgi:DMSO/TMAO reductase YedYZ heme-binding membrane subunit
MNLLRRTAICIRDVVKRPFITVGFTAFVLLIPLAVTSTRLDSPAGRQTLANASPSDLR